MSRQQRLQQQRQQRDDLYNILAAISIVIATLAVWLAFPHL